MFAYLDAHPGVKSLVWFNVRAAPDWVLQNSAAAERQFALGMRDVPMR
ncbi:MAG TPA: hypothetical protein VGF81_06280 [Solirubrobacteraceae bacterium]|jgi:hypothetical protein